MVPFQDAIKEVMAGTLSDVLRSQGGDPTGWIELRILYGKSPPTTNLSRFFVSRIRSARGAVHARGDGGERVAAARTCPRSRTTTHRSFRSSCASTTWFVQPWISGFSPPVIQTHWKYMDIDVARQSEKRRGN
jgi:hypothetical protein